MHMKAPVRPMPSLIGLWRCEGGGCGGGREWGWGRESTKGGVESGGGRVSLSSGVNQTTVQFYPLNTSDTGVYNCSVSVSASGQQYVDTSIAVSSSTSPITVKGQ